jgi:hypothetical protein
MFRSSFIDGFTSIIARFNGINFRPYPAERSGAENPSIGRGFPPDADGKPETIKGKN